MQRTLLRAAAAALLCAGALAACGGGGGGGVTPTTLITPTPAPTASATPTPTPAASNSGTATVTSAATAAPIPAAGGYTGTLNLPPSNAAGSVALALTTTTVAPSGLAPMAIRRTSALPTGSIVLLYETITSPATITFSATPEIDLTLPSQVSTSGVQFFIAAYDPAQGWQEPAAGPATVKGQTVTFASVPQPFTLQANVTYTLALYSVPVSATPTPTPAATATPTPTPTASATPTPTATATPTPAASKIVLSPSPLSIEVLKIGSFTASENGYSGSFTAKATSGTCEVWAPNGSYGSGATAIAPDGVFDVSPSDLNACTISVSDGNGNSATLDVIATVAALSVNNATLSLMGTGSANAQTFSTVGGVGPFTVDGFDSSIVSVDVDPIDQTTFHVTPLKAGATTITVHDSTGQTATVSVGVTTLSGVIQ